MRRKEKAKTKNEMPRKAQPAGRNKVHPVLEPLLAERFDAGVKKKTGPVWKRFSAKLRAPPKHVENPYQLYTVSYKVCVLSYWKTPSICTSPTQLRKPNQSEVVERFKIPKANLYQWRKEEEEGKYEQLSRSPYWASGGGRKRK